MPREKQPTPPMTDLLPTGPMTAYTGKSARTLERYAAAGALTKFYVGGRTYWSKTEVDALVTTQRPEGVERSTAAMRAARDWASKPHSPAPPEVVERINRIAASGGAA